MKDISLATLGMFAFGVLLWLCYGISIHAAPVVVWNALSLALYLSQIGLKLALENGDSPRSRSTPLRIAIAARIAEWTTV